MRRRGVLTLTVLVLLGLGIAGWMRFGGGWGRVSTDNAVLAAELITIAPRMDGWVDAVLVRANQPVAAGDVLIRLSDRDLSAALTLAGAELAMAREAAHAAAAALAQQPALLATADADHAAATASLARWQAEQQRVQHLQSGAVASRSRLDEVDAALAEARAKLAGTQARLTVARGEGPVLAARAAEAAASLTAAEARLAHVTARLDDLTLKAPVAGIIGNLTVRLGEYAEAGDHFLTLVPTDGLFVEANFKETEIARLRHGQEARISIDALPGVELTARVDSISPASGALFALLPPQNATGNFTKVVQRVPTRLALEVPAGLKGQLRPGLSVIVTVDPPAEAGR